MNIRSVITTSFALALGFGPFVRADALSARSTPEVAAEIGTEASFGSGSWSVVDGGNYYMGATQQPGQLKVTNKGMGRVSVHIQWFSGFYTTIHLPPGATLCRNVPANVHVEIWDGGRDGLGANGNYSIP